MVLIVVGICILAAAVHFQRRHRTPADAVPVPGTVVDVSVRRSTQSGSNRLLYGVTVEYRDPQTGSTRVLPPDSHQAQERAVGERVTLLRDPRTGEVRLPLPNPGSVSRTRCLPAPC